VLTIAYVISTRAADQVYEPAGATDHLCADCGDVLRIAPWTFGILERHPAALLLCPSCGLRRKMTTDCRPGATTPQLGEVEIVFRRN